VNVSQLRLKSEKLDYDDDDDDDDDDNNNNKQPYWALHTYCGKC